MNQKICPRCGKEIDINSKFCPFCGLQMMQGTEEGQSGENRQKNINKRCPNCGKEVPVGSAFCIFCGSKIGYAGNENTTQRQTKSQKESNEWTASTKSPGHVFASCDYMYTEQSFITYLNMLWRKESYMYKLRWIFFIVCTIFTVLCIFLIPSNPLMALLGTILFGLGTLFFGYESFTGKMTYAIKSPQSLKKNNERQIRTMALGYFAKHGATNARSDNFKSEEPWAFRERIEIGESGILISFGPLNCSEEALNAHSFKLPWNACKGVSQTKEAVLILCRDDIKINDALLFWLSPGYTGGMASMGRLVQRATQYEDALIPNEYLCGMTPKQLYDEASKRINLANRNWK